MVAFIAAGAKGSKQQQQQVPTPASAATTRSRLEQALSPRKLPCDSPSGSPANNSPGWPARAALVRNLRGAAFCVRHRAPGAVGAAVHLGRNQGGQWTWVIGDLLPSHDRSPIEVVGACARGAGRSMAAPTPLRTLHPLPGTRMTLSMNLGHKNQVSLPKTSPPNRRPSPNLVPSPNRLATLLASGLGFWPFFGRGPQRP